MYFKQIPKKNGNYRTIAVPNEKEKLVQQQHKPHLQNLQRKICDASVVHGFMEGKSPVTNAKRHIGRKYTITMDLEDFFHSVTFNHVGDVLSHVLLMELSERLPDGRVTPCPQGLPLSPLIANLAAAKLDKALLRAFKKKKWDIVYTRYADDLAFSYDDPSIKSELIQLVQQNVTRNGFKIAPNKTHYMPSKAGRRVICGISVGEDSIKPSREARRRLRAAEHSRKNPNSLKGLREWCKLKEPTPKSIEQKYPIDHSRKGQQKAYRLLREAFGLPRAKLPQEMAPTFRAKDFILTQDVAYKVGMSTFTTNWRSCMELRDGAFRKRPVAWLQNPDVFIAALLSDDTANFNGVIRQRMKARALVFTTEDNTLFRGNVYGEDGEAIERLKQTLKSMGIDRPHDLSGNVKVKGSFDTKKYPRPYMECLETNPCTVVNDRFIHIQGSRFFI